MPSPNHEIYKFGRFWLSPSRHALYLDDAEVPLAPKSFDVLLYLAQNPGRLVTKDELLKAVWADAFIEEANLSQQVFRLRKAFESVPAAANLICTMPGRGYQFTADVSLGTLEHSADTGYTVERWRERAHLVVEELAPPRPATSFVTAKRLSLAAAVLGLAALASWLTWRGHNSPAPTQYRQVVIADFINSTGDPTFDRTLRRALEVDLEQSPYMDVLSERNGVSILQLMGRSSDTPLTADVAREICERTNRSVLIEGSISSVGPEYLLTLLASDCNTGKSLTSAKVEAADKGKVLAALDTVAALMRSRLGESAQSLASYQVPLKEATTPSLEALKAYSTGKYLQSQGRRRVESIAAFQRAVELDPNFAMAYRELGIENRNLSQFAFSTQYFQKAYDLSGHLSNYEQLLIRADYYAYGQSNLIEGIKAFQVMASVFPHDPVPIYSIMDESTILGQYAVSISTGERGLKLFPDNALIYENLGEAYMKVNRFDDCEALTRKNAQIGKGDTGLHLGLFDIAFAKQDKASIAVESQWFDAHEDGATVWYFPSFRGEASAADGKYRQALPLYENAYRSAQRANLPETADKILIDEAAVQLELGFPEAAAATLRRIDEPADNHPQLVSLQAGLGDTSSAERFLAAHSVPNPDTLMTYIYLPRIRAAVALQRGKPLDAIAALDPAKPYEMRDFSVPTLRGDAYLRTRQAQPAVVEYRKVLDNPGIDPTSVLYPLAHLGLARAYAMQAKPAEARQEYEALFTLWKDADPDLPVLQQAHLEYAKLNSAAK